MAPANLALKNGVLALFLLGLVYSGFAWPLRYGRGLWPWNRGWFMFSSDSGWDYHLVVEGERADGTTGPLDYSRLFRVRVGDGDRLQETPRNEAAMRALAGYLCTELKVRSVSLTDHSWRRDPGRRLAYTAVPESKRTVKKWVERQPCGG